LHVYAEAMARASPPKWPTHIPRGHHEGDPRVLDFLDITATVDDSFPADRSDSGSTSSSGGISEHRSSMSTSCSDDSSSPSS
jgi:hypothetical protein